MNFILFDGEYRNHLLPFTFTRPLADIRIGILTIREKWNHDLKTESGSLTQKYLQGKYPIKTGDQNILINAAILPDSDVVHAVSNLGVKEKLMSGDTIIAAGHNGQLNDETSFEENLKVLSRVDYSKPLNMVEHIWSIFQKNGTEIDNDLKRITKGKSSAELSETNTIIGNGKLFVEQGAKVECATINTNTGPVYIGKDAEIMEGSLVRGPLALCEHATIKMGAKIYGATTIGPHCKVGGEINNSVLFGYSNKAHDGFLGNSVVGEWCNLGADTNNSNLKNNYSNVKVWSYLSNEFSDTGMQFCGLFMGDHSKASINTMFNTGTVIGVCSNIFGDAFPPKYIPSFSWGGAHGFDTFDLVKAKEMAKRVMSRRNIAFNNDDEAIFDHLFKN